jgi:hypothetical protein
MTDWIQRWKNGETGWHKEVTNSKLVEFIDRKKNKKYHTVRTYPKNHNDRTDPNKHNDRTVVVFWICSDIVFF